MKLIQPLRESHSLKGYGIDQRWHWFNHIRITLRKKSGIIQIWYWFDHLINQRLSRLLRNYRFFRRRNSWVLDHTLCTSGIAGNRWVRWFPSHSIQGNLSLHFERPVFSTVSTWLAVADYLLSAWPAEDESLPPAWTTEAGWLGPTWLREVGCWKASECSKTGWPWNQTLHTSAIEGHLSLLHFDQKSDDRHVGFLTLPCRMNDTLGFL